MHACFFVAYIFGFVLEMQQKLFWERHLRTLKRVEVQQLSTDGHFGLILSMLVSLLQVVACMKCILILRLYLFRSNGRRASQTVQSVRVWRKGKCNSDLLLIEI